MDAIINWLITQTFIKVPIAAGAVASVISVLSVITQIVVVLADTDAIRILLNSTRCCYVVNHKDDTFLQSKIKREYIIRK